jgi:hypothetical protein
MIQPPQELPEIPWKTQTTITSPWKVLPENKFRIWNYIVKKPLGTMPTSSGTAETRATASSITLRVLAREELYH